MSVTTEQKTVPQRYRIPGIFSIQDIKFDILKIIEPYDGYMFNKKDTDRVRSIIESYLSDLYHSRKIMSSNINTSVKDTTITYDILVKISQDKSPKKLKIHVGRLPQK